MNVCEDETEASAHGVCDAEAEPVAGARSPVAVDGCRNCELSTSALASKAWEQSETWTTARLVVENSWLLLQTHPCSAFHTT